MKKRLSSPPQCPDDVDRLQSYPVKLMQHPQEPAHQLLQQINQLIATTPATILMLQELAKLLGITFGVDCCLVTVMSEPSTEATIANWCHEEYLGLPHSDEIFSMEQLLMELNVVQCAAEPLNIEDISTIQKSLEIGCQSLPLPIKAVLAIPTRFRGKNNGVISLIKFHPHNWTPSEQQLLKTVESSCAIALSQVAQSQLIASQQQHLQKNDQYQSLIKQLTILSRSNLELNQMLQLAIASAAESLQADRGLFIMLKYTDPLFRTRSKKQIPNAKATVVRQWTKDIQNLSSSTSDILNDQSFVVAECGLCQHIFTDSGKPVVINDYAQQKDIVAAAPLFALEQYPAMLLMPLESQGRILGFLVLQQAAARTWQAAELNLVEMVCAQVSNAIIQSQTLRQVQNLVDERTAKLQSSLELQAKLHERTRQYVEQLRELNELKDEFLSNMSDRLRYPLTNMMMSIKNLRLPGITADRQNRYLDILEQECSKEINLINDLLTLQKLESQQATPLFKTIDLNTRVQDLAASFETKLAEKSLSINLDLPAESLKLQTEIESFDRILQELLTNACKYSEHDTFVELQATHEVNQLVDQVIIKVTNTGRGISSEEATYIFDKFRRGKGRWTPGTGLGLALAKSLVQHLNGTIAVESTKIADSDLSKICFTLTLPQFSDESKLYSESD
ncbi:GAF domain-containing protein [Tolypothrix sp. FACHB-123]|uniref:GAF domain-containing sensor histidine kinase n=1 Tax=Tolypothrix sp. FACHB-123 TaxID=2692868 RepID=UPI001684919E|nr:GAF domain-containing protein [Tolypothrix sp. FACHB-123]MBD2356368.1 GAF domain-containing protein [Tolypothrix sp. FACHB-123]